MQKKRVQTVQWFEKMTVSFQLQWKLCRWHKGGDRKLSPLKQSLKKICLAFTKSTGKPSLRFMRTYDDQHLANKPFLSFMDSRF